ncbi:MAG: carbohydrate binding domain-containing protein [Fibrobacteraceae bacterium]|nr:carbohydrate binding domain-containing protein [Fibrobacteraceae bacterium]
MWKVVASLILLMILAGGSFAGTQWNLSVGSRTAIVYAPDKRDNPALVISMHGIGIPASWNQSMMKFEVLADTANFIVVYPSGENNSWDLGSNKDVNFIVAIIDSMYNRYKIDRNRVYASGFSMGGMMSWYLSCKIPDKIAAIVAGDGYPLSGLSGCSEVRHVPALQIHGTADDFVSYSGFVGSFLPAQISRYGCPTASVKTKPYPVDVDGRNASQLAQTSKSFMDYYGPCEKNGLTSELALISVDGMIHDWATPDKLNASDDVNYKGKPFDVNGTWEAWNWMRTHSLNGTVATIPAHRDSIYNGTFAEGTSGWTLNVWAGGATGSVTNGEYKIAIDSIGTNNYQIQLIQAGLILEKGQSYEVSFDAYSSLSRSLEVNVEMNDDPWTSYLSGVQEYSLSTSKQTFKLQFTMEQATDSSSRVSFNAGASTSPVYVDNISIKKIDRLTDINQRSATTAVPRLSLNGKLLKVDFAAPGKEAASLMIFDLNGNSVKQQILSAASQKNSEIINLSSLSNGIYIVKISNGKRTLQMSRITVTK